jgi:hypothetical protein
MEPEISIPRLQVSVISRYHEVDQSSPYHTFHVLKIHLLFYSHLRLGLPNCLFPSGFPTKTLYKHTFSPTRATCPADLILLNVIAQIIFGEEYRSVSSGLCNFLHSPFTLSFCHSILKYPQSTFLSQTERPRFTSIKK